MAKLYDTTVGDRIKDRLKQLEKKETLSTKAPARTIIDRFKDAARHALAKGYTLEEIRQIAHQEGLEVSLSTLKSYLRRKPAPAKQRKSPTDSPPENRTATEDA